MAHSSTYVDSTSLGALSKSSLGLVLIFLTAPRTSAYASTKHSADILVFQSHNDLTFSIILSSGLLFAWILGLRLGSNSKAAAGVGPNDLQVLAMVGGVLALHLWLEASGASFTEAAVLLPFIGWFMRLPSRSPLNLGSISASSGLISQKVSRYFFVERIASVVVGSSA